MTPLAIFLVRLVREAANKLNLHGIQDPESEAEILLASVMGLSLQQLRLKLVKGDAAFAENLFPSPQRPPGHTGPPHSAHERKYEEVVKEFGRFGLPLIARRLSVSL